MSPRPGNRQRATLSKQALVSQTNAGLLSTAIPDVGNPYVLRLTIPVAGTGPISVGFVDGNGIYSFAPGLLTSPTTIEFDDGGNGVLVVWIESAPGLKTSSNGKIDPRPLNVNG